MKYRLNKLSYLTTSLFFALFLILRFPATTSAAESENNSEINTDVILNANPKAETKANSLSDLRAQNAVLREKIISLNSQVESLDERASKLLSKKSCNNLNTITELLDKRQTLQVQKSQLEVEQTRILNIIMTSGGGSPLKPGDPNKGGYPYASQCPEAKINHRQYADRWGMYICENVSYVAWRVEAAYGYMPYWGGRGNANQWINSARQDGYKVSNIPKPGAVGISMAGPWGHAVWVEAVNGNRVYISQYNYRINGVPGQYSEMEVSASAYAYIYFDEKVSIPNEKAPKTNKITVLSNVDKENNNKTDKNTAITTEKNKNELQRNFEKLKAHCATNTKDAIQNQKADNIKDNQRNVSPSEKNLLENPSTLDSFTNRLLIPIATGLIFLSLIKTLAKRR